jgi:hypothetical protein
MRASIDPNSRAPRARGFRRRLDDATPPGIEDEKVP